MLAKGMPSHSRRSCNAVVTRWLNTANQGFSSYLLAMWLGTVRQSVITGLSRSRIIVGLSWGQKAPAAPSVLGCSTTTPNYLSSGVWKVLTYSKNLRFDSATDMLDEVWPSSMKSDVGALFKGGLLIREVILG